MGSFANSVHVRCDDAGEVVDAIQRALDAGGYERTDETLDEEATWGLSSSLRGLQVSDSHDGWVGLLDSDLMQAAGLAADLSRRLETCAIQFMVNDSDSWHYLLWRHGMQLDEFDSSGGTAGHSQMDEELAEMADLFSGGMPDFEERCREMQQQMEQAQPPEIREIQRRMQQGTATQEEMLAFAEWFQQNMGDLMGAVSQIMPGTVPFPGVQGLPESDLRAHAEKLRPILPPDAAPDRVLEVLGRQAVFAEVVLEEFLPLVGIQPFFAFLSYSYLGECTDSDLLEADIRLIADLRFRN